MIISTTLALALGYFIVNLIIRIGSNVITGKTYRQALQLELANLRLNRMLAALGINRERYLHQQNTRDIHQHMQRCRDCGNTAICDEKLSAQVVDQKDIEYCNNADALTSIITRQEKPDS